MAIKNYFDYKYFEIVKFLDDNIACGMLSVTINADFYISGYFLSQSNIARLTRVLLITPRYKV